MALENFLTTLAERLGSSASVRSVYGEPVVTGGTTIIPVARIGYGFGGCTRPKEGGGEGAGAGGGMGARPVGVLEITASGTRFIPLNQNRNLAAAALAGFLAGLLLVWRLRG